MALPKPIHFEAPLAPADTPPFPRREQQTPAHATRIDLTVVSDLAAIEQEWRAFEAHADCTAFQTFDWLSAWQRHVGTATETIPAIVVARDGSGDILCILPFAVSSHGLFRRLTWLGSDLCDYNAPLLAADFAERVGPDGFLNLWRGVRALLRRQPNLRHDIIDLEKMPAEVGRQANPFVQLPVSLNPSHAYLTHLSGTWEEFYNAKRSSATRRRDRTKRKRMAETGPVSFTTATDRDEIAHTLDILMDQKAAAFAHMGVANLFARPGYSAFFHDLATNPQTRDFIHVSRFGIGSMVAATNFGLVYKGRYYHVLASHVGGEASRFGPGAAHLQDLLAYAIGLGLREFDFTIGDERYKRDWCDTEMKLYDYIAAASLRGWPAVLLTTAKTRLKRFIKQTPIVWNAFTKVRALLGSFRKQPQRDDESAGADT